MKRKIREGNNYIIIIIIYFLKLINYLLFFVEGGKNFRIIASKRAFSNNNIKFPFFLEKKDIHF